jgi:hypothetical protein
MRVYSPEEARKMILAGNAPADMIVNGDLDLSNSKELTKLPKGLRVEGWLNLEFCTALKHLSEGLIIHGNLYMGGCISLTHLPDDLIVEGDLHFSGCISLTKLPDDLSVKDSLYLGGCIALKHLPKGLIVRGWLYLMDCTSLTKLPDDLSVKKQLNLEGCTSLTELPAGLKVGDFILLTHPLHIPNTVKCDGFTFLNVENFPRKFINNPQLIKVADVLNEQNAQKRSVLLELMGIPRFMREANPAIVYQDVEFSGNVRQLLRVELPTAKGPFYADLQEEPIVVLSVTCPSTSHHYMLRVPPTMQTCHQAATWIAGFDNPQLYQPVMET